MKRSEKITVRVTPVEMERMRRNADRYGFSVSDYVRRMVLLESGIELERTVAELNFYKQIGKSIAQQSEQFLALSHAVSDTTTKLESSLSGVLSSDLFPERPRKKRERSKNKTKT